MKNKTWPFWVTGTFWTLVFLAMVANGLFRLLNMPHIDFSGFDIGVYMTTVVGLVSSALKWKSALVWLGCTLIATGILGFFSAFIVASEIWILIAFGRVSVCAILIGIPNLIALKA